MSNEELKETIVIALVCILLSSVCIVACGWWLYEFTYDEDETLIAERNREFAKARADSFNCSPPIK